MTSGTTAWLLVGTLAIAACGSSDTDTTAPPPQATAATITYPEPPPAPDGPNDAATRAFDEVLAYIPTGTSPAPGFDEFITAGDTRHAWLVADLLRFAPDLATAQAYLDGFATLTGVDLADDPDANRTPWTVVTNHLIAWDTPAPPDYQRSKGDLFALADHGWQPFFGDVDAEIDWRWIGWGGVFIDDRPLGDTSRCVPGCIPALDDPALVDAAEGDYYPDDAIVFGVDEGGEAVAFPKNVMQVHEMVNITIGGRRFGIPYCTLCGSAQAFATDAVPGGDEPLVLRTSGLLNRSNKVMYDLTTMSVFDTFTGAAVSGPLHDDGVVLEQHSVTVSTWGEWKAEHPDTSIVAEDGGIGRSYADDPLDGRDDNGPIFPIGDVDNRLGVQQPVLGVLLDDGTTIAFGVDALRTALADSDEVRFGGVTVTTDGGGFVASTDDGEVGVHEAFWFAWSQFHPDTALWPNDADGS
ncbi:uncharacterized protein DUF3179 [Ilumatobacter fluminis]|uniref:Uncharacterized protein DUF3179 n=1 Tax=Ilumatobacter fluminis TaxID=467091 RepID=A0A4R7HX72_9ACTN|nr:DUF3179 domain-containing (seleno)protein [Ilumatobacter fluminis]TDT14796.1 uncharacterized protein DUF3179 [Ilumatobacter fluminis]